MPKEKSTDTAMEAKEKKPKTARTAKEEKIKKSVEKALHKYGARSPEELAAIASSDETPVKLRADIWKWFAEMEFGKPRQKSDSDDCQELDSDDTRLDGDLELWSR